MCFHEPAIMHALLSKLADNVADYVRYQVRNPVCLLQPHGLIGGRTLPAACSMDTSSGYCLICCSRLQGCEMHSDSLPIITLPC